MKLKSFFVWVFFLLKFMNHRAVREDRANFKFSQAITADSPPLQIVRDRNPTKTLWFPSSFISYFNLQCIILISFLQISIWKFRSFQKIILYYTQLACHYPNKRKHIGSKTILHATLRYNNPFFPSASLLYPQKTS